VKPLKILVVDDDRTNLHTYEHLFLKQGYTVTAVDHPQKAFYAYRQQKYDVVLCDLRMPSMTGDQLMELCYKVRPEIPFVFLTAYGTINLAVSLLKNGAFHFLTKPIKKATLLKTISDAVRQSKVKPIPVANKTTLLGSCPQFLRVIEKATIAAKSDASILISGENGTGKELVAKFIHEHSLRSKFPMVVVNCGAIPENLLESELFGVKKGAFTGATQNTSGRLYRADKGTLFLDEIGDVPFSLQVKLLRVIQEKTIERLGDHRTVNIDFRLITATHKNLTQLIGENKFREDLFYRINVISIQIPPLRDRIEDLQELTHYFLEELSLKNHKPTPQITQTAIQKLKNHNWPGNIRELRNVLERAIIFSNQTIDDSHLFIGNDFSDPSQKTLSIPIGTPLREIEKKVILDTLEATGFDKELTARLLGTTVRTLYRRFDEWREKEPRSTTVEELAEP